jgi:nucleoside-diphosphate-sugar epimerase
VATRLLRGKAHIVYLYTIYGGKYDPPWRFMGTFLRAVRDYRPYKITTPFTTRDFVHIDRLCELAKELCSTKDYKTVDFGSGRARSLIEVFDNMRDLAEKPLDNVEFCWPGESEYDYCASEPYLKDTFAQDLKREWERLCRES